MAVYAPATATPLDLLERKAVLQMLNEELLRLPPRQERVLRLRYGLDGACREHTLREIGDAMGVTGARIRQLEAIALRRIIAHVCRGFAEYGEAGYEAPSHRRRRIGRDVLGTIATMSELPGYDNWKTHNPADDCCEFCGADPRYEGRDGWQPEQCTGECRREWRDPDAEYDAWRDERTRPRESG